jgi:hypothetical protein
MRIIQYKDVPGCHDYGHDGDLRYGPIVPEFQVYHVGDNVSVPVSFCNRFSREYFKSHTMTISIFIICVLTSLYALAVGTMALYVVVKYEGAILPETPNLYVNAEIVMMTLFNSGLFGVVFFIWHAATTGYRQKCMFILAQIVSIVAPVVTTVLNIKLYYSLSSDDTSKWNNVDNSFVYIVKFIAIGLFVGLCFSLSIVVISLIVAFIRAKK